MLTNVVLRLLVSVYACSSVPLKSTNVQSSVLSITNSIALGCQLTSCIHGICLPHPNGTHECFCENGYTGISCDTNFDDCVSAPCYNGGQCVDGIGRVDCICDKSFTGAYCENEYTHCSSQPCQNGGHCTETEEGYNCTCNLGFEGDHCEVDISVCNSTQYAKAPCLNGATCIEGIGISYICSCPTGYEGPRCEIDINECLSAPCQNNATCVDQVNGVKCVCSYRWTGEFCEQEQLLCSPDLCSNKGICLGNATHHECYCAPDYHGLWCHMQYDECLPQPKCQNGGTCIDGINDFKCLCPSGFTGTLCETQCNEEENCTDVTASTFQELSTLMSVDFSDNLEFSIQFEEDVYPASSIVIEAMSSPITSTVDFPTLIDDLELQLSTTFNLENNSIDISDDFSQTPWDQITPTSSIKDSSSSHFIWASSSELITSDGSSISWPTLWIESNTSLPYPQATIITGPWTTPIITTDVEWPDQFATGTSSASDWSFTSHGLEITPNVEFDPIITSIISVSSALDYSSLPSTKTDDYLWIDPQPDLHITLAPTTQILSLSTTTLYASMTTPEPHYSDISFSKLLAPSITDVMTPSPPQSSSLDWFLRDRWTSDCLESLDKYSQSVYTTDLVSFNTLTSMGPSSLDLFDEFSPSIALDDEENKTASSLIGPSSTTQHPTPSQSMGFINGCTEATCNHRGVCYPYSILPNNILYECQCQLPFDGPFCEKYLPFNFIPSFSSNSYLEYILNISSENYEIEISFQTIFENDFFNNSDRCVKTFMKLGIRKGFMTLSFSCGLNSVITMEEEIRVDDGQRHKVVIGLQWNKQSISHGHQGLCNASMQLDQWPSMTGQQHDIHNSCKVRRLYVGGFNLEKKAIMTEDDLSMPWFKGCVQAMMVNNKVLNLVEGANYGLNIKPCNLHNCSNNPCFHGSACQSDNMKTSCICPVGFSGQFCEQQLCSFNYCGNGRCLIVPTTSGDVNAKHYACLCPLGYGGSHCQTARNISEGYFHGTVMGYSSFVAYILDTSNSSSEVQLSFAPITFRSTELLVYIDLQHQPDSPRFIAVGTYEGIITLQYNFGFGTQLLKLDKALNEDRTSRSLTLKLTRDHVQLTSDGESAIRDIYYWSKYDNHKTIIYVGGHEAFNFTGLTQDLVFKAGFKGCIYGTAISVTSNEDESNRIYVNPAFGRNIDQCHMESCLLNLCKNGGTCTEIENNFKCECSAGWFGAACEIKADICDNGNHHCSIWSDCVSIDEQNYVCDCFIGWTGLYCDEELNISTPHFNGIDAFMSYRPLNIRHRMVIHIEFKTFKPDGLLFYATNQRDSIIHQDFILVTLNNGHVELRCRLGMAKDDSLSQTVIKSRNRVSVDGATWHRLQIGRDATRAWIHLDMREEAAVQSESGMVALDINSDFYLGGIPRELASHLLQTSAIFPLSFFHGCIHNFSVNFKALPLAKDSTGTGLTNGINIGECNGSACRPDTCANGGKCIQAANNFHCECRQPYTGPTCLHHDLCVNLQCQNGGKCLRSLHDEDHVVCHCPIGWAGDLCQIATRVSSPQFNGESYILVADDQYSTADRTRNKITLSFKTNKEDSLILWTGLDTNFDDDYFGIGLSRGQLSVVWNLGRFSRNRIFTKLSRTLANSKWHHVAVIREKQNIIVRVDNITESALTPGRYFELNTLGNYYLGGLRPGHNISFWTDGHFHRSFSGCLKDLVLSETGNIINFNEAKDGINIQECYS